MKALIFLLIIVFLFGINSNAQDKPTTTIRGTLVDYQTQRPIPGASITITGSKLGANSQSNGEFRIEDVPAGRHELVISAIGYETQHRRIVATSGKELIITAELNMSVVELEGVTVTDSRGNFEPINESAIVSSVQFTVDDVERFAGSRMDPARAAQNYPGVIGANDQRNDIIIRGGSPTELLWRLDGLDIPNPNHFATQGATGGPVSALNSTLLDNSDFLTGAFPAEYGDKMSGVFDLRTRRGNDERYEFMGQFGFNGFEFGAEGPLPMRKSSFLANYRYSFLDLLNQIGFDFGFSGIPRYQDGTLKLDLAPAENHHISVTGLFGISKIDIKESLEQGVETGDSDISNGTDFGSLGINWKWLFAENAYGNLVVGTVYSQYHTYIEEITTDGNHRVTDISPELTSESIEAYHTARYSINYSPSSRHFITAGVEGRFRYYDLYGEDLMDESEDKWLMNERGNSVQTLSYINWNWRITEDITANMGLHSQYLALNENATIEPRFGLSWRFLPAHKLELGFGVHRQSLPLIVYFDGEGNEDLDFMQSIHYVAGYSWQITADAMMRIEGYYKDISKAPVERSSSYWSFLNSGTGFGVVEGSGYDAVSEGLGKAYGAEFSVIRNFSGNYYITATASYVRQQYLASDGVWRFGAFDNIYIMNLLAGYEWTLSPSMSFEFSGKYTLAGGNPYIPIDIERSILYNKTKRDYDRAYSVRTPDYSRFDLRIDLRHNMESVSVISYISAENIFNTHNVLNYKFNKSTQSVRAVYQTGFFFVGGVRVEF